MIIGARAVLDGPSSNMFQRTTASSTRDKDVAFAAKNVSAASA